MTDRISARFALLQILLLPVGLVFGCSDSGDPPAVESQVPPRAIEAVASAPTLEDLSSATYTGVSDQPVTLTDGKWEGEPFVEGGASRPTVGLVDTFYLASDLNGDGQEEAVALLWTSSGGSGTFDYLAVIGRRGDRFENLGAAELGDRVKIRSYRIDGQRVVLDVVQAGPDDARCCPGQKLERVWELSSEGLVEVATEDQGRLSVSDLAGVEWLLKKLTWEESIPDEPEITLVFKDGTISGSSGCNRYNSEISDGEMPGDLSVGLIASTRMACSDEIDALEQRFLEALSAANQYSFLAGSLVLNWSHEGVWNTMIFAPRPIAEEPHP